jgi:hypothetical protein
MTSIENIVRQTARSYFLSWPNREEIGRECLEDMIVDKVVEDIEYAKPRYENLREDGFGLYLGDEFISFEEIERVSLEESAKIWTEQ